MSKHYIAIRDAKVFAFDPVELKVYLSADYGATWGTGLSVNINNVAFAHIFENGNILFCSDTKAFYSDNNLATYQESTVLNIDGNPFIGTSQCFRSYTKDSIIENGVELLVWGCYSTTDPTWYVNINAWYSVDNGVTIKSFWKVGTTLVDGVTLSCKHIHGINHCYLDNSWWMSTGDGTDEVHIVKWTYDYVNDIWSGTKIAGDNLPSSTENSSMCVFKSVGLHFYDGYVYWCTDTNPLPDYWGIWRCPITTYGDKTKNELLFRFDYEGWGIVGDGAGKMIASKRLRAGEKKKLAVTKNGVDWSFEYVLGGIELNDKYRSFIILRQPDNRGYFMIDSILNTESIQNFSGGEQLMLKIK